MPRSAKRLQCRCIIGKVVFLGHFKNLPDGRQSAKVRYPLDEVLLLCLVAVIARAEAITDIARFGDKNLDLLRRFRPFVKACQRMITWAIAAMPNNCSAVLGRVASLTGVPEGVVAIDGKTVRRSKGSRNAKEPIHMVSAFAARQRLVLGQVKADKPMRSSPFPSCWTCWPLKAPSDHRFHGLPACHRPEGPGQEGRLHLRPQRQ